MSVTFNWSTTLIMYIEERNASTNYTTHCLFDIGLFLRYAGTITVVLGLIGNLISILVFSRKALRSRSCSIYFLALSVCDLWVLFGYTFENLLFHGYGIQLLSSGFMCKTVIFIIYAFTDVSNYLLTLAAIDRSLSISYRSTYYRFCRVSTAKILIAVIMIIFSLINSHFLYGFKVDQNGFCLPGPKLYIKFYVHHYDSYIDIIKTVLIPFIIIFVCNIFIIIKLTRKHRFLRRTSVVHGRRRQEKDRQLTGFLLLTSLLFVILSLPAEINDFLRTGFTYQFQVKYACELWTVTTVFILLHQVNHASHFYVYTLTGPMFRRELKKMLCHFKSSNQKIDLCNHYKRSAIMIPHANPDDVDDQRLESTVGQLHSCSHLSFRIDTENL